MIDKEKLLKEIKLKSDNVDVTWVYNFIKNFPEEPEIDFDALFEECGKETMAKSFVNFLKSKNICAPVNRKLPAKTIYTLKKEYQDVFKDFGFLHSTFDTHSYEPLPENIKKYYDRTDEVDFSAIPKGSIVEVRIKGVGNHFCKFHSINDADGSINLHCVGESDCTFKLNKDDFIRVVEWAKEV